MNYYIPQTYYYHTWYYNCYQLAPVYYYPTPVFYTPFCDTYSTQSQKSYQVRSTTSQPTISSLIAKQTPSRFSSVVPASVAQQKRAPFLPSDLEWDTEVESRQNLGPVAKYVSYRDEKQQSLAVKRSKVGVDLVTPKSASWANSANSLVDDMVRAGELELAMRSCEGMVKNSQELSSGTYLRYAVLLMATATETKGIELALDRFNQAAAAGSTLSAKELQVPSLSEYFKPLNIDLVDKLDRHSKVAMESQKPTIAQLLAIAALLKLDGQTKRSQLFADEAFHLAAESGDMKWISLLTRLRNELN